MLLWIHSTEWICCVTRCCPNMNRRCVICGLPFSRSSGIPNVCWHSGLTPTKWLSSKVFRRVWVPLYPRVPLVKHGKGSSVCWRGKGKSVSCDHTRESGLTVSLHNNSWRLPMSLKGIFASVECAKFMNLEDLPQQHNSRPVVACVNRVTSCENIISLHQLARQISSRKTCSRVFHSKSPGISILCCARCLWGARNPCHSRVALPRTCTQAGVASWT